MEVNYDPFAYHNRWIFGYFRLVRPGINQMPKPYNLVNRMKAFWGKSTISTGTHCFCTVFCAIYPDVLAQNLANLVQDLGTLSDFPFLIKTLSIIDKERTGVIIP